MVLSTAARVGLQLLITDDCQGGYAELEPRVEHELGICRLQP